MNLYKAEASTKLESKHGKMLTGELATKHGRMLTSSNLNLTRLECNPASIQQSIRAAKAAQKRQEKVVQKEVGSPKRGYSVEKSNKDVVTVVGQYAHEHVGNSQYTKPEPPTSEGLDTS